MKKLAEETVFLLKEKGLTFATAESCTGGLISATITQISGVSAIFYGGMVTYNNEIKNKILGVKKETLEEYSAVSQETAEEMAYNICEKMNVKIGVAVTGNAGPNPSENKPVGMVYVSVYSKNFKKTVELSKQLQGNESRDEIRKVAVKTALLLLQETVKYY